MDDKNPDRIVPQVLASQAELTRLAGHGGALKRIAESAAASVREARERGVSFDIAAKQARAFTVPPLNKLFLDDGATVRVENTLREMNEKAAARRRAIDQATIDTPAAIRALVDLHVADRAEARRSERIFIRLAAAGLLVSIIGLVVNFLH
jgi:hypothetical protein